MSAPYSTQREALQKAAELFDKHGPLLEIELHTVNKPYSWTGGRPWFIPFRASGGFY
jgi:hypothetical protein